jgi:hypothetical protein
MSYTVCHSLICYIDSKRFISLGIHRFEEKDSIRKMTYKQLTLLSVLTSIQPLCILFVIFSLPLPVAAVFGLWNILYNKLQCWQTKRTSSLICRIFSKSLCNLLQSYRTTLKKKCLLEKWHTNNSLGNLFYLQVYNHFVYYLRFSHFIWQWQLYMTSKIFCIISFSDGQLREPQA